MITRIHENCKPSSCAASFDNETDPYNYSASNLTLLTPYSIAASHFQSVKASSPLEFEEILLLRNISLADKLNNKTYQNENGNCDLNYKYRSFSGACNNLQYVDWGRSNTAYTRLLKPKYSSPSGKIAKAISGNDLPNARYLSSFLFVDKDKPANSNTLAVMQWGQVIAHDVSLGASSGINCCTSDAEFAEDICYPIKLPINDTFYSKYNQTCINMVRTHYIYDKFGSEDFRAQISNVSHFMDLSNLYGSDVRESAGLRHFHDGLLLALYTEDGREFLPKSMNPRVDCNNPSNRAICFRSGDFRLNQNTHLTCLQTILLREHNQIARELSTLNPHWNDEIIFQTARSILIAIYQHISLYEWVPTFISEDILSGYDLNPAAEYYIKYRDDINPATLDTFAVGAFRGFHSAIQGHLTMMNSAHGPLRQLNISDWMYRPGIVVEDSNFDELLIGLTTEAVQLIDIYFSSQMTEMLFHGRFPYGEDLLSFDIQRGRDHGIPSYNDVRELCGSSRAETFEDLTEDMGSEKVTLLSTVYEHVDDIDFFVGGMYEINIPGSTYGRVFTCIITEQFVRKKYGDRFWHEVENQTHSFTIEQLKEIRKSSFSYLVCRNADTIKSIQPAAFAKVSESNKIVPCDSIPQLNLSMWMDS